MSALFSFIFTLVLVIPHRKDALKTWKFKDLPIVDCEEFRRNGNAGDMTPDNQENVDTNTGSSNTAFAFTPEESTSTQSTIKGDVVDGGSVSLLPGVSVVSPRTDAAFTLLRFSSGALGPQPSEKPTSCQPLLPNKYAGLPLLTGGSRDSESTSKDFLAAGFGEAKIVPLLPRVNLKNLRFLSKNLPHSVPSSGPRPPTISQTQEAAVDVPSNSDDEGKQVNPIELLQ